MTGSHNRKLLTSIRPQPTQNILSKFTTNTESDKKNLNWKYQIYVLRNLRRRITEQGSPREEQLSPETKALRDDLLLKKFMQGLLPKIREAMWNGRLPPDYNWDQATQAAKEA